MVDVGAGDVARSLEGHAAVAMGGTDDRWILIQLNTFTNWVNEQLRSTGMSVDNLQTDLCDGIRLCGLVQHLQAKKRIGRVIKKPMNQHHYLENVSIALTAMQNDNIRLVNIGSEDIVNGNMKLIMGVIWHLILRYQIGKSKLAPRKLMLAWLNAVIPQCNISNFSSDWNDGVALSALLDYCRPGIFKDWQKLNPHNGLENCRVAMEIAKKEFGIPLVVSPENLSSPDLDELSGMTYLSYFMMVDSPGYSATLKWVQDHLPEQDIKNFQSDWSDGTAVAAMTASFGEPIEGWPDNYPNNDNEGTCQKAMNAALKLGVNPVISAKEFCDPEVDHIGVMAYAAWFQHLKPIKQLAAPPPVAPAVREVQQMTRPPTPPPPVLITPPSPTPPPPAPPTPPPSPPPPVSLAEQLVLDADMTIVKLNMAKTFLVSGLMNSSESSNVKIEVRGPTSDLPVKCHWSGDTCHCGFTPVECGHHKLVVYADNQLIPGCPMSFNVPPDPSKVTLHDLEGEYLLNSLSMFQVDASKAGSGKIRVEARSPTGRIQDLSATNNNGVFSTNFTPSEVGEWTISIFHEGEHIKGSPFNVRVYDAAQVRVLGLENATLGKQFSFQADTRGAGQGTLTADVRLHGKSVPVDVVNDGHGLYKITFTPVGAGTYTIRVHFAGLEVTGSPFTLEIVDVSRVSVSGEGISTVAVNRASSFIVSTRGAGAGEVKVNITSPSGHQIPCRVTDNGNETHRVEYSPTEVGEYKVDVFFCGQQVGGTAFKVQAFDRNRILVKNLTSTGIVNQPVEFDIDATFAGSGNLEIMVNEGRVPCSVQNRGNRSFRASFVPREPITHQVQLKFNGQEVPGSPWSVKMRDLSLVKVTGTGLQRVGVGKPTHLDINTGTITDAPLNVTITSPSHHTVPTRIINNQNGTYRIEYTPMEIGNHLIDIKYADMPISNSPFTSKAYDSSAVTISQMPPGMVGKPIDFTIDVTRAGEGQLEIMVNRGTVPNQVTQLRKGVFKVSFTPANAQPHHVDVKFNGEHVSGCPMQATIMDASRVTLQGEGISQQVAINKASFFRVNTQAAGEADLVVRVTAPSGRQVPVRIHGSAQSGYDAEYVLTEIGTHCVDVEFGNTPIPNSPFYVKTYDPEKVTVSKIDRAVTGKQSSFTIDASQAGEGNMQISIGCGGKNIQNKVRSLGQGKYEVLFTPLEGKTHHAEILYNNQPIAGCPFAIDVLDVGGVSASGSGLNDVPCNKMAVFTVLAKNVIPSDLGVFVTGPDGRDTTVKLTNMADGSYRAEWMPVIVGDHRVSVNYAGVPIKGSPFTARAYDASKVVVSNIGVGKIGKPSYFNIDASKAGIGNLEIIVSVAGTHVPNFVKNENNSNFEVSFTPQVPETHIISVKFNDEVVPGSPFYCSMVDGGKASASGDGLTRVPASMPAYFTVDTNGLGEADLDVDIMSPSGLTVPSRISGNHMTGFRVEYTPTETGRHRINIHYADVDIIGSPFLPEVYNARAVKMKPVATGFFGNPVNFEVDASEAGDGPLHVEVHSGPSKVPAEVRQRSHAVYDVTFMPRDSNPHTVDVTFHGHQVPGSPFVVNIVDGGKVSINWDRLNSAVLTGSSTDLILDPHGVPDAPVEVHVRGSNGIEVPTRVTQSGSLYLIDFVIREPGAYSADVQYGGQRVTGSPVTFHAYDPSQVVISDIDHSGQVHNQLSFTVDSSRAGIGNVEAEVMCGGAVLPVYQQVLDVNKHRYTYTANQAGEHRINVRFNNNIVPGCPHLVNVTDPSRSLVISTSDSLNIAATNSRTWVVLSTQGTPLKMADLQATIRAPNGELVPAQIVLQPGGDYKVEYSSKYTGKHMVEILYSGQAVMGSPFYVEIYDPNKIKVEGHRTGTVGTLHGFDLNRDEAGKADLGIRVVSPSGQVVNYDIRQTQNGEHVSYMPEEDGVYKIYITYGGLEVPGCPLTQTINQAGTAQAEGEGLSRGEEGKMAKFYVNSKGMRGDLFVQVDAPNSIAKCNVEPERDGVYAVSYVPVEVGIYTVLIKWNGQEIPGSPFHPSIINPAKVRVAGGWQALLDNNNRMTLHVNQLKRFELDTTEAGTGRITADIRGPSGSRIPTDVEPLGNGVVSVSFTPYTEGEHQMGLFWNDIPLPRSPYLGYARGHEEVIDAMKVVVNGRGLLEARINEDAEFMIDGRSAGQGQPSAVLKGMKSDVQVNLIPAGNQMYRCVYRPIQPGAYLLYISWSNQNINGSPFKVNVVTPGNSSKVVCSGEGLKIGVMGREIKSVIDTRRAGPGELTAHCTGPTQVAFCELTDHRDGTFTLHVKPQEAGKHMLNVKYGGEHVPGSPYVLRISGAPDASKVRVTGPGVEHGILATYQSRFICETKGAGAGQLTVRIRGPRGAFRVEMQRESQKDRTILCRYDPSEVGDYIIHIKWSGDHIPGSPFHVQIFDTREELENFLSSNPGQKGNSNHLSAWNAEV